MIERVAFGGGCHWCTEAVFQILVGVHKVEQGYIASTNKEAHFSEAVIVHFNRKCITLKSLIEIHLLTHASQSNHSMRKKYRSAIYTFSNRQMEEAKQFMEILQNDFKDKLVTQILPFYEFKPSREEITNYYIKNPGKPFCEIYIKPKLQRILNKHSDRVDPIKEKHLII